MCDKRKPKIWSTPPQRGVRLWHFLCSDCALSTDDFPRLYSCTTTTRWDWTLEDALEHLELYH